MSTYHNGEILRFSKKTKEFLKKDLSVFCEKQVGFSLGWRSTGAPSFYISFRFLSHFVFVLKYYVIFVKNYSP